MTWANCPNTWCRVWNQCMNSECIIAPKTTDKDIDVSEWVEDPEFGLVPLKEFERLSRKRNKELRAQNANSIVHKATPIVVHNPSIKQGNTIVKHTPQPKPKEPEPMAGPARPAKLIRDMNDLRISARNRIMDIEKSLSQAEAQS